MRRTIISTALTLVVLASAFVSLGPAHSATSQDQTDERLAALETQVAEQTGDINSLWKHVRVLETAVAGSGTAEETTETADQSDTAGSFVVEGTGAVVTDNYRIEAGRYQVQLQVDSGCCIIVDVYGEHGDSDMIAGEIFTGEGGSASFIYEFSGGEYFFEVSNTESHWSLTFVPR